MRGRASPTTSGCPSSARGASSASSARGGRASRWTAWWSACDRTARSWRACAGWRATRTRGCPGPFCAGTRTGSGVGRRCRRRRRRSPRARNPRRRRRLRRRGRAGGADRSRRAFRMCGFHAVAVALFVCSLCESHQRIDGRRHRPRLTFHPRHTTAYRVSHGCPSGGGRPLRTGRGASVLRGLGWCRRGGSPRRCRLGPSRSSQGTVAAPTGKG